ncbi:DNA topoisomerase I [Candidatus Woesearchaeota archaeon]|nr:DNA topoisomerase I [Candidatus Woesearchaeota archaeon]
MAYELIITEKPNAAKKIADALSDGKPIKKSDNGVPYYLISHNKEDLVVACAVGHLYGVAEKNDKSWKYPTFEIEWKPTSSINKASAYTKKYLSVIKKVAKDATNFTIATDYDIEGEVIGLNVLRFACKQKDANRMKFSTLTKDDLIKAFEHKSKTIDWGQANAGVTRHELDWYYGINLSRALMSALRKTGSFKVLSSGRVQGPALKILVDKEKEIQNFKPEPYWQIALSGLVEKDKKYPVEALHQKDKFFDGNEATTVFEKVKDEKSALVSSVTKKETKSLPPIPFDLTSLQLEAHKVFKIVPKQLLELAQNLYINGFISYPRTSSQKLPKEIDYKKILKELQKNEEYKKQTDYLLALKQLIPKEGTKDDPAHPAIYPTGIKPTGINDREKKVYDLIVKRFFAVFGEPALRETMTIEVDIKKEIFVTKGTRTKEEGWFELYAPYVKLEEAEFPDINEKDTVKINSITKDEKETSPPKRYTAASIIKELEKRNLGTKATRASIIDALYQRGYVNEKSIQATKLGIRTCDILEKYSSTILDEELTRHFEDEMESIRKKEKTPQEVLDEAQKLLTDILTDFKKKELDIGKELKDANFETANEMNTIGECPVCKEGMLVIKQGKFGRFIACDKYPDCSATFKIPQTGVIKSANKNCEHCAHPMLTITKKGTKSTRSQTLCINPECPSLKIDEANLSQEMKEIQSGTIEKDCPKCKGKLVLRKSIYGQFLGCSNYPKCKYTERIEKEKEAPKKEEE